MARTARIRAEAPTKPPAKAPLLRLEDEAPETGRTGFVSEDEREEVEVGVGDEVETAGKQLVSVDSSMKNGKLCAPYWTEGKAARAWYQPWWSMTLDQVKDVDFGEMAGARTIVVVLSKSEGGARGFKVLVKVWGGMGEDRRGGGN